MNKCMKQQNRNHNNWWVKFINLYNFYICLLILMFRYLGLMYLHVFILFVCCIMGLSRKLAWSFLGILSFGVCLLIMMMGLLINIVLLKCLSKSDHSYLKSLLKLTKNQQLHHPKRKQRKPPKNHHYPITTNNVKYSYQNQRNYHSFYKWLHLLYKQIFFLMSWTE